MALATLADFKIYAGITKSDKDPVYNSILESASSYIEQYVNRSFTSTEYSDIVSINESGIFLFPHADVTAVSSVTSLNPNGSDNVLIDPSQYILDTNEDHLFFRSFANIDYTRKYNARVVYTAGLASVPLDIQQALFDLVLYYYKREFITKKDNNSNESVTFQTPSIRLPAHIARSLTIHRDWT